MLLFVNWYYKWKLKLDSFDLYSLKILNLTEQIYLYFLTFLAIKNIQIVALRII